MQVQSLDVPRLLQLPGPDESVIPGVLWGKPEWVPSAAFWATMASLADEERDGYVHREVPLAEAVGFCLLGGYGITAELNQAAHDHLRECKAYEWGAIAAEASERIEELLREPLNVGGKSARYRFPRQRAHRLVNALRALREDPPPIGDDYAFRSHLMRINGIGPKTGSWIARNWLGSGKVAILDIHVVRAGKIIGLFSAKDRLPRDYLAMERRFLRFAEAIGACPSLLDAIIWRTMREINVGRG